MITSIKCRLCDADAGYLFAGKLTSKEILYYRCKNCDLLQTEEPTWLEEAYSDPINAEDTGILFRNDLNVKVVIATLFALKRYFSVVVDYAGGYGILVRSLRDLSVNAFWLDKYCQNIFAKGCEYSFGQAAKLVTAFEVVEHFDRPRTQFKELFSIAPNVLISTELLPEKIPLPNEWWYYGCNHGQHISFYTIKTLKFIANSHHKKLVSIGGTYHLFCEEKVSSGIWVFCMKLKSLLTVMVKIIRRFLPQLLAASNTQDEK
jgi:hypothetical protein